MAHSFVVPEQVLSSAIALLRDDLTLSATVNRDYEADFGGGRGHVVNVRVPATLTARRQTLAQRGTAITTDELTESTIPVTMTHMVYSAVDVTDADLTMDIEDYTRQITRPQVVAMVEDIENMVASTMQGLTETLDIAYSAADPVKTFTTARKRLRDLGVPADSLWAAVGTDVYADLLEARAISDVSQSGSTEALRNAQIGRVRGFNVLENNRLEDNEIIFYGRDAFTLAIRAPRVPDGAAFGASASENGFAMRWVKDYDSSTLKDRSIFSTFIGCQAMKVKRLGVADPVVPAIRIDTATVPAG